MISYAVFTLSCLLAFYWAARYLLVPVPFYVIYGDRKCRHPPGGSCIRRAYFPGFFTAQAYWVAGPWLLYRLIGSRQQTAIAVLAFSVVIVPLVTIFMVR